VPKSISTSTLKDLFDYKDGHLYWKSDVANNVKAGSKAGCKASNGYTFVKINKIQYVSHRLIYQLHYGEIADDMYVDHINCNRSDSKIENLRLCNIYQNAQNRSLNKDNKSGSKNVHWMKASNKWKVQIRVNGAMKNFGLFDDLELADLVATEARDKYFGAFANHGVQL
jgi:hypothetical protein